MDIGKNISEIKKTLPAGVKLVAVSKTKPIEVIQDAYQTGHKIFGENKAQELTQKHEVLPKDIEWHFIGHLQSNKTKYIAPFVNMIHGIDSFKILKTVNKEARKNNRVIPCLLQFHIAQESTKFGFSEEEAREMLESETFAAMKNVTIAGVMGMATFTDDEQQVRNEFKSLKSIFEKLKNNYFPNEPQFKEVSMGMSDDYSVAVEEGSTIVRIGSIIFGARQIKTT
ncbi:YggS family pyridoxal phosphate-dependent enzyme [Mariniphaga sediminis]|uniref:YggS family pyridoxal phosphate-dependent enzyme n=1 Tax=Mariniphaga sediminis TaxID=1628158 RepID=UPI003561459C